MKTKEEILDKHFSMKDQEIEKWKVLAAMEEYAAQFKDSPYQGSAGTWVKASERLPKVGIYNALYNGDHVIFQVHDGGFRVINYHGEKNDSPKLFLIRYLDDSAAAPAGDGWNSDLAKALDEYIKLLEDELSEVIGFTVGAASGWKSARYEKGMELRARINELKTNK